VTADHQNQLWEGSAERLPNWDECAKNSPQGQKNPPSASQARRSGEASGSILLRRRGRCESFASLRGFWLGLWFGRLLDFFSTFVFASHGCKCATKGRVRGRVKGYSARIRHMPDRLDPGLASSVHSALWPTESIYLQATTMRPPMPARFRFRGFPANHQTSRVN
jgi:hypothetical protein